MIRHGDVGIVPFTKNAQSLEVLRLPLQGVGGELATGAANAERRHVFLFFPELAFDVQLNRQPVWGSEGRRKNMNSRTGWESATTNITFEIHGPDNFWRCKEFQLFRRARW